jgi:tRNA(Ile)-lysidine synthase TilS/MesJ
MTSFPTQFTNPSTWRQGSNVWASSLGATPKRREKRQKALITLSGGQDSSLVSWLLFHTQHYYPCQPQSLHYQHFLHPGALYSQKHCSQLSFWFNWKSLYYSAIRSYASEKDAGDWRSESSFRLANYYTSPFLFKGQNLTDHYETRATLFLRTLVNTPEKTSGNRPVYTENSPIGAHSILFARQKKLSYWNATITEKKVAGRVKLYRRIKYGR